MNNNKETLETIFAQASMRIFAAALNNSFDSVDVARAHALIKDAVIAGWGDMLSDAAEIVDCGEQALDLCVHAHAADAARHAFEAYKN